jgi:hypothetical protein
MAGTQFSGNQRTSPVWAGDFGGREHILPWPAKVDASQFTDAAGVVVTVGANAAQNATSVTVTALAFPGLSNTTVISSGSVLIPAGTTLYFGGAKVATLTANAKVGDTTLTVAALPTALVSGDTATYSPHNTLFIPSGTAVGRTWTERNAGTPFGPAAAADDEIFFTMFDVVDARTVNDIELYRPGSMVKENYLPGYGTGKPLGTSASPSSLLTAIRSRYQCIVGVD